MRGRDVQDAEVGQTTASVGCRWVRVFNAWWTTVLDSFADSSSLVGELGIDNRMFRPQAILKVNLRRSSVYLSDI